MQNKPSKVKLEKAIKLAKTEIKEWQDFLIDCYKKLEKIKKGGQV